MGRGRDGTFSDDGMGEDGATSGTPPFESALAMVARTTPWRQRPGFGHNTEVHIAGETCGACAVHFYGTHSPCRHPIPAAVTMRALQRDDTKSHEGTRRDSRKAAFAKEFEAKEIEMLKSSSMGLEV